MAQGNVTVQETYAGAQTSTTILTPSSGKKLVIWDIQISSDAVSTLDFETSGITAISLPDGANTANLTGKRIIGAVDEPLKITCGTNTEVIFCWDEL